MWDTIQVHYVAIIVSSILRMLQKVVVSIISLKMLRQSQEEALFSPISPPLLHWNCSLNHLKDDVTSVLSSAFLPLPLLSPPVYAHFSHMSVVPYLYCGLHLSTKHQTHISNHLLEILPMWPTGTNFSAVPNGLLMSTSHSSSWVPLSGWWNTLCPVAQTYLQRLPHGFPGPWGCCPFCLTLSYTDVMNRTFSLLQQSPVLATILRIKSFLTKHVFVFFFFIIIWQILLG